MKKPTPTPASFGKKLRKMRTDKDLKIAEVADAAGLSHTHLSKVETGSLGSIPRLETIDRLAIAMGCTPAERRSLVKAAGRWLTDLDAALLAEEIAEALFTTGDGRKARNLMLADATGHEFGGWGKGPARDQILRILRNG